MASPPQDKLLAKAERTRDITMTRLRFAPALLLLVIVSPARGQAPAPGKYSEPQYGVQATRGHLVPMRDGVKLSVDVYLPLARARFPAILIQTPYDNNGRGFSERAKWFA